MLSATERTFTRRNNFLLPGVVQELNTLNSNTIFFNFVPS